MTDPKNITPQQKQLIRETLAGYAAANEVIRLEKREWLQRLTPAESWATYEELSAFGRTLSGSRDTLRIFEPRRMEEHLAMRRVFEKLAQAQGFL